MKEKQAFYKAYIFDLDGTLLNTLDDLHNAVNYVLAAFSRPLRTKEETRLSVGNGVGRLIELSLSEGCCDPDYEAILAEFKVYYATHSDCLTAPYDGITELLRTLKEQGILIGVVSNKFDAAVKVLCEKYFQGLYDIAIGESEFVRRKPYPDSLFWAINALGLQPDDCLYIGDSETDVLTARAAGVDCLSVLWGFRDRETLRSAGADRFVTLPNEILA